MTDIQLILPTSIEQREQLKHSLRDAVLNGEVNVLDFYRIAKLVTDVMDELKKDPDIFDCAWQERNKYGKEKAIVNGAVIDVAQKSTPDYRSCNDSTYNRLREELSAREKFLKAIPSQGTVDPESGELIMPPVMKVTGYVTVKL